MRQSAGARTIGHRLVQLLPLQSELLYRFCRKVVDHYRGDNNDDPHSNGELRVLRTALREADVIFDVGANVGEWLDLAMQIRPRAAFHAFEPCSGTYDRLRARGLPANVTLVQAAAGATSGSASLFVVGDGATGNSLYDRSRNGDQQARVESVPMVTLDDYCAAAGIDRIDYLKIDVEGHELAVLQGGAGMMEAGRIDTIQFEYGGTYLDARIQLRDVVSLAWRHNARYRLFKILPRGLASHPTVEPGLETFQYSNWLLTLSASLG
jgi:FkbM family methyltransferase